VVAVSLDRNENECEAGPAHLAPARHDPARASASIR
jgi:hypothetical protein